MPKLDRDKELNLRSRITYQPIKTKSGKFCKSFFPHISKIWNNLANDITNKNMNDFKIFTNTLKPKKFKHFSRGNKYSNSLLTKIRIGRSDLNQHFTIGLIDSLECDCHWKNLQSVTSLIAFSILRSVSNFLL